MNYALLKFLDLNRVNLFATHLFAASVTGVFYQI